MQLTKISRAGAFLAVWLLAWVLAPSMASAHRVVAVGWAENGMVFLEVGFGDGSPGSGAKITLSGPSGQPVYLTGEADDAGLFEAPLPAEAAASGEDLLVVADAGGGHMARLTIDAEEVAAAVPSGATQPAATTAQEVEVQQSASGAPMQKNEALAGVDQAELERMIREAVREELRPLRRKLETMSEGGPGPTEIMGGIGYLLGLAGLIALLKRPRREDG